MFSKDDKSFNAEANPSKTPPANRNTLVPESKKKLPKETSTREIDKDYALRLIRDHFSHLESQKA